MKFRKVDYKKTAAADSERGARCADKRNDNVEKYHGSPYMIRIIPLIILKIAKLVLRNFILSFLKNKQPKIAPAIPETIIKGGKSGRFLPWE